MKKNWKNRSQACLRVAELLKRYDNSLNTVVVGLARGGVEVAYAISSKLNLPLDVICPKKISHPFDPEYAIGAITEYGDCKINYLEAYRLGLKDSDIAKIKDQKLQEAIEKEKIIPLF